MAPCTPDRSELIGATLRRAYCTPPPEALPDRLSTLLSLIAAQTARPHAAAMDARNTLTPPPE